MNIEWITDHVITYRDVEGNLVFRNRRGIMVNGNRQIHMANWELEDLQAIVDYLKQRRLVIEKDGNA